MGCTRSSGDVPIKGSWIIRFWLAVTMEGYRSYRRETVGIRDSMCASGTRWCIRRGYISLRYLGVC